MTKKELKIIETLQEKIKLLAYCLETTNDPQCENLKTIWATEKATLEYVIKIVKETK